LRAENQLKKHDFKRQPKQKAPDPARGFHFVVLGMFSAKAGDDQWLLTVGGSGT